MADDARIHPRLLRSAAELRFGEFEATPLDELRDHATADDTGAFYAPSGASRITRPELERLQAAIRELANRYEYPELPNRRRATAFDRDVAELLLHDGALFPAEAAAPEVWSFHALVLAPEVVFWRWRDEPGRINRERVVGSDLTRHAFGRMWWRAYLLCARSDGELDFEGLDRWDVFGEADFDQIQARRRAYGGSPRVLQQLTELWLRRADAVRAHSVSDRDILRDLLKRLLRLGAFVRFDLLDDDDLADELDRALDETLEGLLAAPEEPETTAGEAADRPAGSRFDEVPLNRFVVLLTELLVARGPTRGRELASLFEEETGIEVPANRERWLTRFAWVANGFDYLARDDDTDTWSVGGVAPAPDPRWGDWSIDSLRERAVELCQTSDSPFDELLAEAYTGGRPSKLARAIVHSVVDEAEAALVG